MELLLSCCWHVVEIVRLTCLLDHLPQHWTKKPCYSKLGCRKMAYWKQLPVGAEMGFFGYSYEGQGDDEKKLFGRHLFW